MLALGHVGERETHPSLPSEYYMIGNWPTAARDHVERLIAIYTDIAATYAAHTIDAFTPWRAATNHTNGSPAKSCRRTS